MSIYMSRAELEEISEGLITAYDNKFSNTYRSRDSDIIHSIWVESYACKCKIYRILYRNAR